MDGDGGLGGGGVGGGGCFGKPTGVEGGSSGTGGGGDGGGGCVGSPKGVAGGSEGGGCDGGDGISQQRISARLQRGTHVGAPPAGLQCVAEHTPFGFC